jgi:hypothetical protein
LKVPVPLAVEGVQDVQAIAVTAVLTAAQPNPMNAGRSCTAPGELIQDSTSGRGAALVVVAARMVVVVTGACLWTPTALGCTVGDEEPTARPIPTPAPRAARTDTAIPTRTTVLFRSVITGGSSSAMMRNATGVQR